MLSLRSLYKIGHGPSSSHTMGPALAMKTIVEENPEITYFKVTLYNSLALTGKGHLTEDAMLETVHPREITFDTKIDLEKFANTILVLGYKGDELVSTDEVKSTGGGRIVFVGRESEEVQVYPHKNFNEIKAYCRRHKISLYEYVLKFEGEDIIDYLKSIWEAMKAAVERGIKTEGVLPGPLKVQRKAKTLFEKVMAKEPSEITENRLVSAYAFAVSEENAAGGIIVTAPTCGACGVLPALLYYMRHKHKFITDEKIIKALAVAGLFGNLIKHNASISGAVAGCQAEVGSACSMAAAAHATLFNLDINQVEYAAEIAMEHHLGLTCDPINGFVQIPCIERNAVAALRAIDACGLAYFLSDSRKISFDTVIETMYQTGLSMHTDYKETSIGGLAKNYKSTDENCW
ncbi:L-serine ammonia-lyase [Acholeplasma equirhinis]|uniref:L-serine ammonia-lyase n=1 Tax=Acholeplasma equirhinis TaxID=555393 RepID=UPI00197A8EF4|nr:L-serine ammonia-lyase [Acholeplasma equirhinis]MBN3490127.1 L-serine ammonia-lyase [Acholeplasma equirhinis]